MKKKTLDNIEGEGKKEYLKKDRGGGSEYIPASLHI
jgi:hypothetical protein